MDEQRVTVKELREWLYRCPEDAQVCVVAPGCAAGTSFSINEVTQRRLSSTRPVKDREGKVVSEEREVLVIIGVA